MHAFPSMGTEVTVIAAGDEAAVAARVAAAFAAAEQRFSRFRADSELSRLNRARGPTVVSPPLFDALVRARAHVDRTGGLFDPAIGAALIAAGYDRSFAPGALDRASDPAFARPARADDEPTFLALALEPSSRTVHRPPAVRVDLGGMIKGATVDAAVALLDGGGAIDAGGDLVVRGPGPAGEAWLVDVEDPVRPERTVAVLAVRDAAVATSAPNRRRWRLGATVAHHLIDPRTRRPATSDLAQVTVVASSAELAEVLAKAAFLLGEREAVAFLAGQPADGAVLVTRSGRVRVTGALDVREVAS